MEERCGIKVIGGMNMNINVNIKECIKEILQELNNDKTSYMQSYDKVKKFEDILNDPTECDDIKIIIQDKIDDRNANYFDTTSTKYKKTTLNGEEYFINTNTFNTYKIIDKYVLYFINKKIYLVFLNKKINPTIITISGKARHGKDTTAEIIKDLLKNKGKRVLHINYADYVKFTAQKYLGWDGNKDEKGRTFLQWYGTDKVRSVDQNFWVDTVIRFVEVMKNDFDYVVIADARFPNEISEWEEKGYNVLSIHVERLNFESELTEEQRTHESETALNNYIFDVYLQASTLDELKQEIIKKVIPILDRGAL